MDPERLSRNKDELLREVDLRMRLADIERLHRVKANLASRWWEPVLVVILFAASLGLLASMAQSLRLEGQPLRHWMFFWFGVMILTMVLCFQVIIFKLYHFRRAHDLIVRTLGELRRDVDRLQAEAHPDKPRARTEAD